MSDFDNRIASLALQEWTTFGRQSYRAGALVKAGAKENTEPFATRISEYWRVVGQKYTGHDTNQPWSAAFISWLMLNAGAGAEFPYSAAHAKYIVKAIKAKKKNDANAPLVGHRLKEFAPMVGDLIAHARADSDVSYDNAVNQGTFKSHCDLVVAVRPREIDVIGGNVGNSVSLRTLACDNRGLLVDTSQPWFAVIETRIGRTAAELLIAADEEGASQNDVEVA